MVTEKTVANRGRHPDRRSEGALTPQPDILSRPVEEYTDPAVVEGVPEAIQAGNSGRDFPSSYASTLGRPIKKLARDYAGREPEMRSKRISRPRSRDYPPAGRGNSRRNKDKLRQIIGESQRRLLDSGRSLIDEVTPVDRRVSQTAWRPPSRKNRSMPTWPATSCACWPVIYCSPERRARTNVTQGKASRLIFRGAAIWRRSRSRMSRLRLRTSDDPNHRFHCGLKSREASAVPRPRSVRESPARRRRSAIPLVSPGKGSKHGPGPAVTSTSDGAFDAAPRTYSRASTDEPAPLPLFLLGSALGSRTIRTGWRGGRDVQRLLGHTSLETTPRILMPK